ncbi:MAG: alpha/beta hydrolase [Lachnospiraceae bacterium]|nr:alpha/beta hydrolase [Lachnospiraceae bacterium]
MKKSKITLRLALLFIAVFLVSALATVKLTGSAPQRLLRTDYHGTILKDQLYDTVIGHGYDLYLPENVDTTLPQKLILFIHGGSFNSGSKEDGEAWCKYYASYGYIAATLDYSLQKKDANADLLQMNREIAECVAAIKQNCTDLGYDVDEMAVCGVSAGGTLAMNYAYSSAVTSAIPVRFVFQLAGPADFNPDDWEILIRTNKWDGAKEFVQQMTGIAVTDEQMVNGDYEPYIDAISPARLVDENSVPTLCGYGLKDHLVPASSRELLVAALEENGVSYDYLPFPNSNHGMYADLDLLQEFLDLSLEYCERYF